LRSWSDLRTYLVHKNTINYQTRNMLHVEHAEVNILKTGPEVFWANIGDMVTLARSHGTRVLLVLPRYRDLTGTEADLNADDPFSWAVAQHRSEAASIGREAGQVVLDMVPLMPQPPRSKSERSEFYLDSVHMTARGADLFAGFVAQAIMGA
jgi:hypothetical protein